MMLYRKYRPKTFAEVVGQEPIVTTLNNAVKHGQAAHAYLFAGQRGTGKTSVARILAKELEAVGLDLIEIDAASNRGIDDIRELREKVNFLPTRGKKKLYILDEVHMLTTEAFNALLKTLEEPPEHAHFILCTTEPYKVPATILSRCQRFDFVLGDRSVLVDYLKAIAVKEGIKLGPGVLELLAEMAGGSYRDGLVLLEKISLSEEAKTNGGVTQDVAGHILGLAGEAQVERLVRFLTQREVTAALDLIEELNQNGVEMKSLTEAAIKRLRKELLQKIERSTKSTEVDELINLITRLMAAAQEIKSAPVASLPLEVLVVEWGRENRPVRPAPERGGHEAPNLQGHFPETRVDDNVQNFKDVPSSPSCSLRSKYELEGQTDSRARLREGFGERSHSGLGLDDLRLVWNEILDQIKPHNHSVQALLRGCEPQSFEAGVLRLNFFYPFHKERIEDRQNLQLVERVAGEVMGNKVRVECWLRERGDKDQEQVEGGGQRVDQEGRRSTVNKTPGSAGPPSTLNSLDPSSPFYPLSSNEPDLIELAQEVLGGEIIE